MAPALVLSLAAAASSAAEPPSSAAERILRQAMKEDGLPSISVAISRNGQQVYARAFGFADLENQVAATVDTTYSIGSVTKAITAAAALELAEEGKLDLDTPVEAYCPAFPPKSRPVTVRQLLAHTAGIRHYDYSRFEEDFLNTRRFASIDEALTKFAPDPLVADPGGAYHYSSWGYVLVGCAIEGASGIPYPEYVETHIAGPAGMSQTRLDSVADIVPHRARGYSRTDSGSLVNAGLFDPSDRVPAGGLLSTPRDLTRFGDALVAGRLLGPPAIEEMWSPARLDSGDPTGQGLGWNLAREDGAVFHGGTTVGATTYLYVRPAERIVVAIAVNLSLWPRDRGELAERLANLFAAGAEGDK